MIRYHVHETATLESPALVGMAGHLHISGKGVALGYIGDPDLTAKDSVTLHLTTPVLSKFSPLIATFCFFLSSCLFHLHFLTLHSQDSHQLRLVALSSIFTVCFSGFLLLRWQGKKH